MKTVTNISVQPKTSSFWYSFIVQEVIKCIAGSFFFTCRERPEFVSLYYESGGNLWQLNAGGNTGSEESTESSPAKEQLKALLGEYFRNCTHT